MKSKRIKLTAMALSALMAVSTISSVTWAADLFGDGTEGGEAVEIFADTETSDVPEEVDPSEGEELLEKYVDINDKIHVYDPWEDRATPTEQKDKDDVGVFVKDGEYKVYAWVNDEKQLFEDITPTGKEEGSTCEHPARKQFSFDAGGTYYVWYYTEKIDGYVPDEHHVVADKVLTISGVSAEKPDCDETVNSISYKECTVCNKLKKMVNGTWDGVADDAAHWDDTIKTAAEAAGQSIEDFLETNYSNAAYKDYLQVKELGIKGHTKGATVETVLPPMTVNGLPNGEYDIVNGAYSVDYNYSNYSKNLLNTPLSFYETRANCRIIDGKHSGAMDPNRDAYVYHVTFCKDCGEVIEATKDVFFYANITESEEFYMGVKNIAFFVGTDGQTYTYRIPKDKLAVVVLDNCELDGIYNLCVTSKNYLGEDSSGYSVAKTLTELAGHKWGKANATATKGSSVSDFRLDANKSIYTEKNDKGEWVAYAKDCITDAYYTLEQHCLNPNCKYYTSESNPDIGGEKKALPGAHNYYREDETVDGHPGRYVDVSKTKYEQIIDEETGEVDKEHHLEKYTDRVECRLCHEKGWQPSNKADAVVDHTFVPKEVADTREEPTCGTTGSYERVDTCVCGLTDESTKTSVTIPATDDHKFGDNPAIIVWSGGSEGDGVGAAYIADDFIPGISIHADIVRQCTVCGNYDSNGINTMVKGSKVGRDIEMTQGITAVQNRNDDPDHWDETTWIPGGKWCATLHVSDLKPAKTDPATGISYRCSTGHATISVDWIGTVDGKVTKLSDSKENVPYYASAKEYQARTAHTPGTPKIENRIEPTTDTDGSYDKVVYCTVCGDVVSKETISIPKGNADIPTVTASSVDFDSINVTWTPVENATGYRLYYKSIDQGIARWTKIRTFTNSATSWTVNGLTTGAKYRFTVRAEFGDDLGQFSKKGDVAVPKLTAPVIDSVTANGKKTKVSWSKVDGASGYIVFRNSVRVGTVRKGSKCYWNDKKPVSGATYQVRAYRTEKKKNYKSDLSEAK